MIQLGNYNTLRVDRSTSVGVFLSDDEGTEILLPNKYVPKEIQLDDKLEVFCYLDHEERPVATTLKPLVKRGAFAFLQVMEVNAVGAFLDWGLEKQLFCPFSEQRLEMEAGNFYVIYCYLDEKSFRLVASNKIDRFLSNTDVPYKTNDEVGIMVSRKTDLGWELIVDNTYKGLIFHSDVHQSVSIGDELRGYVKQVRADFKIDIAFQPLGAKMLEGTAKFIYDELESAGGFLPLNDKSKPEAIKERLQLSKKAFKKGVGVLYKSRKITIEDTGIRAVK